MHTTGEFDKEAPKILTFFQCFNVFYSELTTRNYIEPQKRDGEVECQGPNSCDNFSEACRHLL